MRLVVLTNGHPFGIRLLQQLVANGAPAVAVVIAAPDLYPRKRKGRSHARSLAGWGAAWFRYVRALFRYRSARHAPVTPGWPLTSPRLQQQVLALRPDLVLLGGIGILPEPLLEASRFGVLNAHPGLLPWVRGTGVVGAALQRSLPVGVTCHYVNAGIDRGALVERRLLDPSACGTLAGLESAADELAVSTLASVAATAVRDNRPPDGTPQSEVFPMCRWLSPAERASADQAIAAGNALSLYRSWAAAANGDRLPPDFRHE